jgi:GntR family transcriptional repressor for pyruvate dehydrogenase complex
MWESLAQSGSVSDRIAHQITDLLAAEELRPGDRLPAERELASLLGVSRPSVREAVRALAAQGRLTVRHGQGVFVAAPRSAQDLRAALAQHEVTLAELFAMREVLEVPAAGWAARAGDVPRIRAAAQALDELNHAASGSSPDFALLQKLDAAFHIRIVEAAGNRFLRQTLGVLQEMVAAGMETTLLIPGRLEKSRHEHEQIVRTVQANDPVAARAAVRRHLRGVHRAARSRLESEREAADHAAANE